MPGALIIGGAHVSIAVARSLGRHGVRVWLLANHPIATYSRFVERSFPWPGADAPDGVSSIIDLAVKHHLDGWVLIATGDQDMRLIAENHALLSKHFRVATPDWQTIQFAYDKRVTYERAKSLGIDFPQSFPVAGIADIEQLDCRFPVILKPAYREGWDEFTLAKAWKAENREELRALYWRASALIGSDAIIVQEWVPGGGEAQFSFAALCEKGEPVVTLTARRRRQHPIDFGRSSTFVETIENKDVEELARRFLKSIDYTGIAEVEFKYDRRDGRYKLLDVNGRFWTWNGLGPLAGVDFPCLAFRQALGEMIEPRHARAGVGWIHCSRDLVAGYQEMRAGTLTLGDYLASLRQPLTSASFALDDPLPAFVELPVAAWNRLADRIGTFKSALTRKAADKFTARRVVK
jgi:D-aspartate ligase